MSATTQAPIAAVLDSNVVNHLVLVPPAGSDGVTSMARAGAIVVIVDEAQALTAEWIKTGGDGARALLGLWLSLGVVRFRQPARTIPVALRKRLGAKMLKDTVDKLMLRIAMASPISTIVSHDSDFWDPHDRRACGLAGAPVRSAILELLGVAVLLLDSIVPRHSPRRRRPGRRR